MRHEWDRQRVEYSSYREGRTTTIILKRCQCSLRWINHWWKHEAQSRVDHVTESWIRPLLVDLSSLTSFRRSYLFHSLNLGACPLHLIEWDRTHTVERWIDSVDVTSLWIRWRVDNENKCFQFWRNENLFATRKNRWLMTIDCFLLQKNDLRWAKLWNKRSKNVHHRKNLQEVTTLHKKR
jgi:hypothetical protein